MNKESLILLIGSFLAGILVSLVFIRFLTNKSEQKLEQEMKEYLNSIIALNLSHLHDAANFFALIKRDLNEKSEKNKHDLENFAKGAAYHFRSLFDDLKNTIEEFESTEFKKIQKQGLNFFYRKESLDLKSLLELELFQLSSLDRLDIHDNCKAEHAIINGNFNLLSKTLLNLIENALKYTEKNIKVELNDRRAQWQLRISSFGKSIPSQIAEAINRKRQNLDAGHGLKTLVDVIDFHNSEIIIDSIAGEGVAIILNFDKYNDYQNKKSSANDDRKTKFHLSIKNFFLLSISLSFISLSLIVIDNKKSCRTYYQSKTMILSQDEELSSKQKAQISMGKTLMQRLEQILASKDYQQSHLKKLEVEILEKININDQNFTSLIIFNYILSRSEFDLNSYLQTELKNLIKIFPHSFLLNSLYLKDSNRLQGIDTLKHSWASLESLIRKTLFMSPKLYTINRIMEEHNSSDEIAKIISLSFSKSVLLEQELLKPVAAVESNLPKVDAKVRELDERIDALGQGVDLDLSRF